MIGWLWRAIVGRFRSCDHTWRTTQEVDLYSGFGRPGDMPTGHRYIQQCELCGDIRKRDYR